ncbi:hypothetical protein [Streptomyces sp. NBC_00572]|uniref:DUF7144 family membrane protein n=1 Tax=Streptomyces sp. NBC_00572 TaxID=2903664 RepID=UPI002B1D3B52|nr:hypothetical protein [Streptomyces sp. NBC_00572]
MAALSYSYDGGTTWTDAPTRQLGGKWTAVVDHTGATGKQVMTKASRALAHSFGVTERSLPDLRPDDEPMSQNTAPRPPRADSGATGASGGTLFAGVLMVVVGILDILQGIVAIAKDDIYTRVGDYVFEFSLTSWGWTHLILGILVALAGAGILKGSEWGRMGGITLASLNAVAQFLFLPYYPWWALFSMAVSIVVVWALATDDTSFRKSGAA